MKDYAPKHYLHPHSNAAKVERAIRMLGDKYCLRIPVTKTPKAERVSLLDRWKAQRHI